MAHVRRTATLALALTCLAIALPVRSARAQTGQAFSPEERRRLRAGELVMRRETEMRGELRLIGGTSFQVVDAPPDAVWEAVLDTARYPRFLPRVADATLVRDASGRRLVRIHHEQGPIEASYHVNIRFASARRMAQFRIDRSHPGAIRDGWGFFIVQPHGEGKSMVTFGIMADVGSGVVSGLLRPRVHEWMLRVPEQLRDYVEGSGRSRYVD